VRGHNAGALAWRERLVALSENRQSLAYALGPATMKAAALLPHEAAEVPPGGTFEISPASAALAGQIGTRIAQDGGAALIVDYGAARPAGEATLQGVRHHARHDILETPGQADLTAHVDFTALSRAAGAAGAKVWGPVPQGKFLASLGIAARAETLARAASPAQREAIAAAVERLIGADRMGELFKILAFAHPSLGPLAGFP
jgi:NADH dehydrogenase [ubiquinone] 1 alpha subcomplex assembly factor 7